MSGTPQDSSEPPGVEWFALGTIDPRKFERYLLSSLHPKGRHKARLWNSVFGIGTDDARLLEALIRAQIWDAKPKEVETKDTEKGPVRRWELIIPRFGGPNGNVAPVLTAWALEPGADHPHLTTAYPKAG